MARAQRSGWKKMPEEVRRAAILAAAGAAFGELGFEKASVQDIAERAELTKGGVYFHFESKEALRTALLTGVAAEAGAVLARIEPGAGGRDPAAALLGLMEEMGRALGGAGMSAVKLMELASGEGGEGRAALMALYVAFHGALADLIGEAQEAGKATRRLPPATLARLLLAVFDGLHMQAELVAEQIDRAAGVPALLEAAVRKLLLEEAA